MSLRGAIIGIGMTSCAGSWLPPDQTDVCTMRPIEASDTSGEVCEPVYFPDGLVRSVVLESEDPPDRDRVERLERRIRRVGDMTSASIDEAIAAALSVERGPISAELLLALAWHESRLEREKRTGSVCGMLQVVPHEVGEEDFDSTCTHWALDIRSAFQAGVDEFIGNQKMSRYDGWLRGVGSRVTRERLVVALQHRACGNRFPCGKDDWIRSVISMMEMLQRN